MCLIVSLVVSYLKIKFPDCFFRCCFFFLQNHMHDQDLYFSKWIGTLGRKIDALESAVYLANGDYPEAHDEQDEVDSHAVACNGVQDEESNPFSPITTCSTASFSETTSTQSKPLSRSSSQLSAATASSGISDITNGSVDPDSDYSTDHKLQTITERHGMTSQSSDASVTSPQKASRVTSMDSVDSLFKKEGCQGVKLSRQGSSSSGIHADELLAMYSKREKGVRQELGLASQGSTPNKHASILGDLRSPSNASLVHEHPDEETLADGDATPRLSSTFSPNTSMNSGTSGNPQYSTPSTDVSAPKGLPNPLVDVPKPVLEYSEIFGPPSSAIESLTSPTSPGPDEDFLTPRLSKRNSGIFGSVRLRASLRNLTRNRISTDKTSSPSNKSEDSNSSPSSRPEKSRWRWGSVRGTNSSSS